MEYKGRKPALVFYDVWVSDSEIRFYIMNLDKDAPREATIVAFQVPRKEFEMYKPVIDYLDYKGYLIKHLTLYRDREKSIIIKPGEYRYICLEKRKKGNTQTNIELYAICEGSGKNLESCSEVMYIIEDKNVDGRYNEDIDIYYKKIRLQEELPGFLTKIPNMLRDIPKYWKIYKTYNGPRKKEGKNTQGPRK